MQKHCTTWRCLCRTEHSHRFDILVPTFIALDCWPTIITPCHDPVHLIECVLTELGSVELAFGVPGESLHIAVAIGVDWVVRERITSWHSSIRRQPENLSG